MAKFFVSAYSAQLYGICQPRVYEDMNAAYFMDKANAQLTKKRCENVVTTLLFCCGNVDV